MTDKSAESQTDSKPIDTLNRFGVARARKDTIVLLLPPVTSPEGVGPVLSKTDALNLAAYIVAMINDDASFSDTLKAIKNT